jgi:hypothetical protein
LVIIRHCVEESNIDENYLVIDPTQIRHVVVSGGKIQSMSGLIDPLSHLNLDYSIHKITRCVIAQKFEIGANIKIEDMGLVFALVGPSSYGHFGKVDYTQRLCSMIEKVKTNIKASQLLSEGKPITTVNKDKEAKNG